MAQLRRVLTYQGVELWRHTKVLQWALQIASSILVVVLVAWSYANIANAVQERELPHGWNFLSREYQTPIGQHFLPYESSDSFGYALWVAAVNTLIVSVTGVILATALGVFIGVARLSGNWLVSKLAMVYIEFFRNVPLLILLFFWFYIILALPPVQDSYVIGGGLYVNNGGISIPFPSASGTWEALAWALLALVSLLAGLAVYRRLLARQSRSGRPSYPLLGGLAAAALLGAISWVAVGLAAGDAPYVITSPAPEGRFGRISGGFTASAGLIVLLVGLVTYTASFIAELVRAGIQSVGRGQTEASRALGLSGMETLRSVTFPQALRVIIPPLISQFLNLTKNSSLAAVIGYADLTSVGKTMTQTAPAVSIFILLMAAYLAMSLTYSLIGNLYNRRIRFTGG